jgi:hypothetical protein
MNALYMSFVSSMQSTTHKLFCNTVHQLHSMRCRSLSHLITPLRDHGALQEDTQRLLQGTHIICKSGLLCYRSIVREVRKLLTMVFGNSRVRIRLFLKKTSTKTRRKREAFDGTLNSKWRLDQPPGSPDNLGARPETVQQNLACNV